MLTIDGLVMICQHFDGQLICYYRGQFICSLHKIIIKFDKKFEFEYGCGGVLDVMVDLYLLYLSRDKY